MTTRMTRFCIVFIAAVVLLAFALMVYAASADTPNNVYLPALRQPEEYPIDGWIIIARWVDGSRTFFTLLHPEGWRLTGVCANPNLPAPDVYMMCIYLGGGMFDCGGIYQPVRVHQLLVTPTATATLTPTATATESPTETPEPTLHPPTGITETPTPGLP